MACLNTLKQEIRTLESIFSKSHERFQIVSASVDELSCRFIGKNGKKYAIHANITVSRCYKTYSILLTAKKGLGGLIFCKFSSNKGSYPSCFFLTFNICSSDSCVCHFCCHFKKSNLCLHYPTQGSIVTGNLSLCTPGLVRRL